ncbi:MAG TPA: hypothetical protein VM694_03835, partial [Polyangium sp.]|nr:hypothetical protein [Polyangium sp.]
TPVPVTIPFDYGLMPLIEARTWAHGKRMLFIYGENDPWSTSPFDVRAKNDAFRYIVPEGHHGVGIKDLPEDDRLHAMSRIFDWADMPFDPSSARTAAPLAPAVADDEAPGPRFRLPPR